MSEEPCPICRHPLAGHGPSCAEAGCACIYDPKGKRVVDSDKRPLAFGSFEMGHEARQHRKMRTPPRVFRKPAGRGRAILVVGLIVLAALVVTLVLVNRQG